MLLEKPHPAEDSPLRLAELPDPVPAPNEIRVRILCCGLCHTDVHTLEGDLPLPKLPLVPGHQIVGTVDTVGPNVRAIKAGDRVGIPWLYSTDGTCPYCRRNTENLCENAQFTGYHVNGGYAEFCVVREDFAHPLPGAFSDENAAPLLCAGVIGYRSYRLSGVQSGQRLGLYGFGASAHLVLQLKN
jgi:alcohol dehydrogenase, propanol-preferring